MNGKQAKRLRRRAKELMLEFVHERVLSPEQCEGRTDVELISTLPTRMLILKDGVRMQAYGTQRFFNRIVKSYPNVTYKELDDHIHNK